LTEVQSIYSVLGYTAQLLVDTRLALEISNTNIDETNRNIDKIDVLLSVLKGMELDDNNKVSFEAGLAAVRYFQPPEFSIGHVGDVINGQLPIIIIDENIIRSAIELERRYDRSIGRYEHSISMLNNSVATIEKYYAQKIYEYENHGPIYDLELLRSSPELIYAVQNTLGIHLIGRAQNSFISEKLAEFVKVLEAAE
jgi:hypothetical protein